MGFWQPDEDDLNGSEQIINFYKLDSLNPQLRSFFMRSIVASIKNNKMFDQLIEDSIIVIYDDWKRVNRKNKLENLREI